MVDWRVCEQVNKQGDGAVPGLGQCGVDVREVRESKSTPLITQAGHEVWATWTMWMAVSGDGLGERKMSSERRQIS